MKVFKKCVMFTLVPTAVIEIVKCTVDVLQVEDTS